MTTRRTGAPVRAAIVGAALLVVLAVPVAAAAPEWNIDRIGAPASARGVTVAVVDTGVDAAHPAFTGRVLPAIDLVGGNGGDPNGHGTHVAGTIAGADNGCGSIGVVPDARVLPVRVLDPQGTGSTDDVAEGIRRAADAGAAVINLSLGTDVALRAVGGSGLEDAIRYAWSKGAIPVLAAGNDGVVGDVLGGSGYGDLPAVVVTATDNQDRVASYATTIGSARWGLAAPGGDASEQPGRDILSAHPGQRCAFRAGTSMAAPHVAGALAALRARGLDKQQAVDRLVATARDLGRPGLDATYGHGVIDLAAALGDRPPAPASPATPPAAPLPIAPAPPVTAVRPPEQPTTTVGSTLPTTTGAPPETAEPAVVDEEPAAPTAKAPVPSGGSASPVVVRDADDDGGDGPPGALVAAAIGAVAASAAGTAAVARAIGRRPRP